MAGDNFYVIQRHDGTRRNVERCWCASCIWGTGITDDCFGEGDWYECHRHAPRPSDVDSSSVEYGTRTAVWPVVNGQEFCGDGQDELVEVDDP